MVKADVKGDTAKRILTDDIKHIKASGKRVSREEKARQEVEAKYADQKKFLIESYERAKFEEQVHLKQKNYNRYKKTFL